MKSKFWIIMLLACLFIVSAKNQSLIIPYSFTENISIEKSVDFSSLLLRVTTDREATCRYDEDRVDYNNMDKRFDLTYGTLHEKSLTNLGDGVYKYYIRCLDSLGFFGDETEVVIRVSSLVTGQIVLEQEEPLRDGRYEITLITSKVVSQAPALSASFDGTVYEPVPLTGSEKIWRGYLIIPKGFGEGVVSFKFNANDLEGRQGSEITSGGAYLIDTVKPATISSIKATGYKGEIKLEWHLDEDDVEEYKIYRSVSPEVKNTDFYSEVDESPFYDNGVRDGATYYYRISAVDEAGNEGDLLVEVSATALLSNQTISGGLDLQLIGKVDNLLTEIDLLADEVESIENSVELKQGKEKELFDEMDLVKEIQNAKSDAVLLRKDVENYKLQDLTENELDNKLNSARVKMNIIRKKVPESITILGEDSADEDILENELEEAILQIRQGASDRSNEKSVMESLRLIKESELKVRSSFFVIEIIYLDGTKKSFSIVKREIESKLEEIEWSGEGYFIETIPKALADTASQIKVKSLNYQVIKEDPILGFGADSREIFYYFEKEISLPNLKGAKIVFLSIAEDVPESGITGYFLIDSDVKNYAGIVLGAIILSGLFLYFLYLKKNKGSEDFIKIDYKIKESNVLLKHGERDKAVENYKSIQNLYDNLEKKERKMVYRKIKRLYNKLKEIPEK